MHHDTDRDACCIHCGMDTCDWPRGKKLPPCPVWDKEKRRANFAAWQADSELDWPGTPDPRNARYL